MFEDKLRPGTLALDGKDASVAMINSGEVFSDLNLTNELKHGGRLLELACKLTKTAKISSTAQKQSLLRFFDSALANNPEKRILNVEELEYLLSKDWYVWALHEITRITRSDLFLGFPDQ
jgi:hypothetical protein